MTPVIQRQSDRQSLPRSQMCFPGPGPLSSWECAGFDDHPQVGGSTLPSMLFSFPFSGLLHPDIPAISCSLHSDALLPSIFFYLPLCSLGKNFYSSLGLQGNRPCCEVFPHPCRHTSSLPVCPKLSVYASCRQSVISCSVNRFQVYFLCSRIHHGLV